MSPGWNLLPSTVIIVLALVNSTVSPAGIPSISMRPRSATLLPVSTASTGLLCLLVGAHVHCVRSDTELSVWLLLHTYHIQCMTILSIPGWAPTEAMQPEVWVKAHLSCNTSHQVWIAGTSGKGNTLLHQRVSPWIPMCTCRLV